MRDVSLSVVARSLEGGWQGYGLPAPQSMAKHDPQTTYLREREPRILQQLTISSSSG